jgi:hypothetical protein
MYTTLPRFENDNEYVNVQRRVTEPIILSIFPHYIPFIFTVNRAGFQTAEQLIYLTYSAVIVISTTFSIAWHRNREQKDCVYYCDYALALLWTTLEIMIASFISDKRVLIAVIFSNMIVFIMNYSIDHLARRNVINYDRGHTIWHIISSIKCIIVAWALGNSNIHSLIYM